MAFLETLLQWGQRKSHCLKCHIPHPSWQPLFEWKCFMSYAVCHKNWNRPQSNCCIDNLKLHRIAELDETTINETETRPIPRYSLYLETETWVWSISWDQGVEIYKKKIKKNQEKKSESKSEKIFYLLCFRDQDETETFFGLKFKTETKLRRQF